MHTGYLCDDVHRCPEPVCGRDRRRCGLEFQEQRLTSQRVCVLLDRVVAHVQPALLIRKLGVLDRGNDYREGFATLLPAPSLAA
jgi:hypothetical protein